MRSFRTHRVAVLVAPAFLALAGLASAAQFSLSMTRIHLGAAHPVETVTMTNQESTPLAFEVHVQRWTQDDTGQWKLVPDDGLVVHPLILRIEPGQDARLRIGSLSPTVVGEVAYRLELAELPDHKQQKAGTVRMLARVSVPVFVQPAQAKPAVNVTVDSLDTRAAHLMLHNAGTAYAAPGDATLRVRDTTGKIVHETRVTTNYVLAGAQWPLEAKLPAGACAHAATVELQYGDATPLSATIAPGARRCAH